jgi:hypothetical protein
MQAHPKHDGTRLFTAHIRPLAVALCAAVTLWGGGVRAASASDGTAQHALPPAMNQRFEAPIGHRQPTVDDIPGSVLRDEGAATQGQRDLDKELDICRGC